MRALLGVIFLGILVQAFGDAMYWYGYFQAPEAMRKEYHPETFAERVCKQAYITTPDHLAQPRDNPEWEAQRQEQLAQWQHGIAFQQRQGCEAYESLMKQSEANRQLNFVLEHSWGLILAAFGMLIGFIYSLNGNKPRRY